jgi:hypothetical protein
MKNNRSGPHIGRGDPQQRSGSRGDPPVICGVRGDPPWMLISRGDPPLLKWKGDHSPEKNENRNSQAIPELVEGRVIGCQDWPHGRGMPKNEQPHSLLSRRLPCTHKYKWPELTALNGSAVVIQMDGINSIPTIQVEPKALTYKSRRDDSCCSLGLRRELSRTISIRGH